MSARSTISVFASRDVEARLDDRRRDEHVGVARQEREHLVLELALAHLAVRDEDAGLGDELADLLRRRLDRLDAVVEVERLAVAAELAFERLHDQLLVVLADVGADRAAAFRRRLDHRDVAQARERHVQRARDRRRAQREHVDLEPELAQQLLLRDAEALLLVDDDEAEILRDRVAREDPVRPDQDVDLALAELGEHASSPRRACGSARPSRRGPGSRGSARGTCSSAAGRGSSSGRASAPACRRRRP